MVLSVTSVGDNPQQPGIFAETYIPDQLIAGSLKLVTQPIVLGAGTLSRGTVLGQQTKVSLLSAAGASNVGAGTIGSITGGVGLLIGNYVLTATSSTAWTVTNPEGTAMPGATTGSAYSQQGLGFTITAGSPVFSAGDSFTINAVDSIGNFITSLVGASDGSQVPCAILADYADASGGPVRTGAYIMGEFNIDAVIYDTSWTPEVLTTALRLYSIYLKTAVSATDAGTSVVNFA